MKTHRIIFFFLFLFCFSTGKTANAPTNLTTDLLEYTDRVFLNGYPTNISLSRLSETIEQYQIPVIRNNQPYFGWVVNDDKKNVIQTAYRILIASNLDLLEKDLPDMWDSGKQTGDNSISVQYEGKNLQTSTVYYWKVKTWNNYGEESPYSETKSFITHKIFDHQTSCYPLQKTDEYPKNIQKINATSYFIDFGKDAFGRLRLTLSAQKKDTIIVHLGEYAEKGRIIRNPDGSVRYASYTLAVLPGTQTYTIKIKPDKRNTGPAAIKMPEYIGEVTPFRYCEIENYPQNIQSENVVRESIHYLFNEQASYFHSSDTILNQIWDLSKYSIKATSFAGVYVDGDRERIPYEADALINQLCHYAVDKEFTMARYSHEYLIYNATWPTEWIMQSVLMAWYDYLYTGNPVSIKKYYQDLKAKSLITLKEGNGLISTLKDKQTPEFFQTIHFKGKKLRDIVDWPHTGILGLEKNEGGETDGYKFTDYNTVVNAYHYKALQCLSLISGAIGYPNDSALYAGLANQQLKTFNQQFFDKKKKYYVDGSDTEHASLHGNMFPLAFGMVDKNQISSVLPFIRSRGMACSVYGAQFLLDALYNANDAAYALNLLTSTGERSWYNMIRVGSTISLEAWDNKYKPNQDWNHAWGAAPANLIPRKLIGIEPLEPGFRKFIVKPQPARLRSATIITPTIRGDIKVSFENIPGEKFDMEISIPHNSVADIQLPFIGKDCFLSINGEKKKVKILDGFVKIGNLGSGNHQLIVSSK